MFLPGIAAMLLMPLVLYFLSPLEIKSTPNASTFAKDKLKELVKMKNSEKIMLSVFVSLLLLWAGALGEFASAMGLGEISIMIFLSLAFLYTHCSYICNVFFVFYSAGLALGTPPLLYAFIMIASGNVMMALTHYATGTAPVIFGTGYVSLKKWWSVGFVISVIDITVMILVGLVWWKFLGFY